MRLLIALIFTGLSSAMLTGCTDGTTSAVGAGEPINTHCPVMGGKIDGKTSTDWNGKTVGFCCPPCIDEWAEMSDEERQTALDEAAAKKDDDHGDHDHGDHGDHDEHGDHDKHGDHDHGDAGHAEDGDHKDADGDHGDSKVEDPAPAEADKTEPAKEEAKPE